MKKGIKEKINLINDIEARPLPLQTEEQALKEEFVRQNPKLYPSRKIQAVA